MTKHEFRASEFMTIREKELVLKTWLRFLGNGLRFKDFTDRLYKHLHLHCGFIAHYDRPGFYETYFENGEDTVRFLSRFDKRENLQSVGYGGSGEYEDLARAMIEEGAAFIPKLMEAARAKQRAADLAEAQRLLAKHGVEVNLTN